MYTWNRKYKTYQSSTSHISVKKIRHTGKKSSKFGELNENIIVEGF